MSHLPRSAPQPPVRGRLLSVQFGEHTGAQSPSPSLVWPWPCVWKARAGAQACKLRETALCFFQLLNQLIKPETRRVSRPRLLPVRILLVTMASSVVLTALPAVTSLWLRAVMPSLCYTQACWRRPGSKGPRPPPQSWACLLPFSSALHTAAAVGLLKFTSDQVTSLKRLCGLPCVDMRVNWFLSRTQEPLPVSGRLPSCPLVPTSSTSWLSRSHDAAFSPHCLVASQLP